MYQETNSNKFQFLYAPPFSVSTGAVFPGVKRLEREAEYSLMSDS